MGLRHVTFKGHVSSLFLLTFIHWWERDTCSQVRRMSGEEFWEDHVRLQKRKDHFLWTIESTGMDMSSQFILVCANQH